jgi:hypothetical protein
MTHQERNGAPAGRKWIGDVSTERVGELWRQEDHEALMTTLRGVDEVAVGLVALAQREASEAPKAQKSGPSMGTEERRNLWGLRLAPTVTNRLRKVGIYARPQLSLEHQGRVRRYVVRGVESGGAVEEIGYYVTFAGENGEPLAWLQTLDSLAANGVHAVVVAPALTRIEMLRIGWNYELSITRHRPVSVEAGRRPKLKADEVFSGVHGYLSLELWGKDKDLNGFVKPQFFTRSGEEIPLPPKFEEAIAAVTRGTACIGCSHPHYSRLAVAAVTSPIPLPDGKHSFASASSDGQDAIVDNATAGPQPSLHLNYAQK